MNRILIEMNQNLGEKLESIALKLDRFSDDAEENNIKKDDDFLK